MKIEIVSGEGAMGTVHEYTGKITPRAIRARLTRERCSGDRWAFVKVDGQRVADHRYPVAYLSDLEMCLNKK